MPRKTRRASEVRPGSWGELVDELYSGSWNPDLRRHRSTVAYRGLGATGYDLVTSLARLGGPAHQVETHLLRNFRKNAHRESVPSDVLWNWLALAQHHG